MNDAEKNVRECLEDLVPRMAKILRGHSKDVRYEVSVPNDSFYLSNMYFVTVKIPDKIECNKKPETISLIVKRPPQTEMVRNMISSDQQFHNEILFYEKFAKGSDDFPRCVYTMEKPPCGSVIVLENITKLGYDVYPSKYDVPLIHTLAAMREIGRFHAKGYVMKERKRAELLAIVKDIHETRYKEASAPTFGVLTNIVTPRAVHYLRQQNYDAAFCDKMQKYFENSFHNIMMRVAKPVEPLATLCHGDFTANNLMFKNLGGVRAILIDFALMRYGTPVIDLSTFFCLCVSAEIRAKRFAEIFGAYYESLRNYLEEAGMHNLEKYSYEALLKDFKEGALFGYVIAAFYLPTLMDRVSEPPEEMLRMDTREAAALIFKAGGDEMSKVLADLLLDLKDLGCMENIL